MKNATGYARVSTDLQRDEGVSLTMQTDRITQYCALYDLNLTDMIQEAGSGSSIAKRPEFTAIVEKIKSRQTDALVVYKLDRLARNLKELIEVTEILQKNKVEFHSVSEKLDTTTANGRLFFQIIGALAEWERATISERTSAALQSKKSKGEQVSFQAPFGYQHIDGMTVPNPHEQACLEHLAVIREANPGIGWKKAATLLHKAGYKNRNNVKFSPSSMKILFSLTCNFKVDISKAA